MPAKLTKPSPANTYRTLLVKITKEFDELELLVKRSTAESYWRVGKYIHEHLLANKERAEYGKALFERLAEDAGRDLSTLRRITRFYRMYPIRVPGRELSWGHYRRLITVRDPQERGRLEQEIVRKQWGTHEVQSYLNSKRKLATIDVTPLKFSTGKIDTYHVVKANATMCKYGPLALDLGFRVQAPLPAGAVWKEGDIAKLVFKDGRVVGGEKVTVEAHELFTYTVFIDKIIDGDTLIVSFDFGFASLLSFSQKLRLAGIDCPELSTSAGKEAKRFVESRMKEGDQLILKTIKDNTDRYDRYLAQIFCGGEQTTECFLNQLLLDAKLAVKYVG